MPTTVTFTATVAGSWTVPDNVYSLFIEGIGGGGGGGNPTTIAVAGGGSGAGYASSTISVVPGQTIFYNVGAGGSANNNCSDTLVNGAASFLLDAAATVVRNEP